MSFINIPHFLQELIENFIFYLLLGIDGSNYIIYSIGIQVYQDSSLWELLKGFWMLLPIIFLLNIFFYYIWTKISDKIPDSKKKILNKYFILWIFPLRYIPVIWLFSSTILWILKFGYWKNIFITLFLLIINILILWPIILKFFK